jgi:hypothetical protein
MIRTLFAVLVLFALASPGSAQMKLTLEQLQSFVKSSAKLKHPDRQVAEYLKRVQLTQKLTDRDIEYLLAEGIGPKTLEVLRALRDATVNLSPPPKTPPPAPAPVIPPPSSIDQAEVITKLREWALGYDKRLPNFFCVHVTRRFQDPSGLEIWNALDTVTAKLTYFENKEEKKVMFVNNRAVDVDYSRLGGATSTGEFGSLLKEIFERESQASFGWERWATLRGRLQYVFNYRVLREHSDWKIFVDRAHETTPGYSGLIFVDKDYLTVSRVTMNAEDIPSGFPLQMARMQLDYDFAEISGQAHLLPLRAELRMRQGKALVKNEVEFRNYRMYGSDVSISFSPDPIPEDQLKEGQLKEEAPPPPQKKF